MLRPAPTIWCSAYYYFTRVTEQHMLENLEAVDELELPVDVIQLDDGYQADIADWLLGRQPAGYNWEQELFDSISSHPDAADYLHRVFATFREQGIDFFKTDSIYAAALEGWRHEDVPPVEAYRRGLRLIRDAIGPGAYLLGCGAPILPSVGLVDAMRVSPDVAPKVRAGAR